MWSVASSDLGATDADDGHPCRCTRWYLPLLLLPYPTAPIYFALVALGALTLHAKPWCVPLRPSARPLHSRSCPRSFYCLTLLSLAFLGSYTWLPVPLDAPLADPWAPDVVTYKDALLRLLAANLSSSSSASNTSPALFSSLSASSVTAQAEAEALLANANLSSISLPERGWLAVPDDRSLFSGFDVGQWERTALERMRDALLRNGTDHAAPPPPPPPRAKTEPAGPALRQWIMHFMFPQRTPAPDPNTAQPTSTVEVVPEPPRPIAPRWEYDLSPYGIDMVLDFGWPTG
jgi:hypothetical protein